MFQLCSLYCSRLHALKMLVQHRRQETKKLIEPLGFGILGGVLAHSACNAITLLDRRGFHNND